MTHHDNSGDSVVTSDHGTVRLVTLNRPDKRNAIDLELRVALAESLEAAQAEPAVRCVVLSGAGGCFCAGGDISTMRRQQPEATRPRAEAAQRVIRAIWNGPKPVIAAVEGFAFGAGAALALACDRVVAAEDVTFNTTFTAVGLAGDMGIFASLPARVGLARARQLMLFPDRLSGTDAHSMGLVDELVPPGACTKRAIDAAGSIAGGPPLALAGIKSMLAGWPRDPNAVLEDEVELQTTLFASADFEEGVTAFHEKRAPVFRGR
ncbi:Enoyl-CoA hydratase/carnithine racemase [Haloechinothrix alba]|uniref:Enoyl-CoA hydratase/carnithine racemase n=1 Tax=Haloechinothrix alba TaxID=664784 RepID=A0A238ZJR1_9PSEU|nr:enoyl-CoA hydratase-related protein [Haloechinothrix alba]SNR82933.1 Enoyl-CoA hydratase/carnithine racemase [Haloechinothrix alba]